MVTEKDIKEAEKLANFKIGAFKAGLDRIPFSAYRLDSKLHQTNLPAGKYMEVVMAWMLGYFRQEAQLYMKVDISWKADLFYGTDFRLATGEAAENVNMKFDRDDARDDDERFIIVRTYPVEPGHAESKKTQCGMDALESILHCVFRHSTILRSMEGRPELAAMINSVWASQSKNW